MYGQWRIVLLIASHSTDDFLLTFGLESWIIAILVHHMSVFFKKDFHFCSRIFRGVCDFSIMVLPSIFHIKCKIGFTAFQADDLGMGI
jgi:hypothetical protein